MQSGLDNLQIETECMTVSKVYIVVQRMQVESEPKMEVGGVSVRGRSTGRARNGFVRLRRVAASWQRG